MTDAYDSRPDTEAHIGKVQEYVLRAVGNLYERALDHDASKLEEPEKSAYDTITPRLKGLTYGSEEYRASLREMKPAIHHHYRANDHHPEHHAFLDEQMMPDPEEGEFFEGMVGGGYAIGGMSLMALTEMVCDWKAASERHADGDFAKSLEINGERFGIDGQLMSVIRATARELGFVE